VRWATLESHGERRGKFEQKSALQPYDAWERSTEPLTDEDEADVPFNPTPGML
jgi:hypothetical protein